ncbi:MAG: hypothetical protein IE923_00205 [Micrococcales bacterium]|nr:hypothetical protein [Micrococcales bacterium]
MRSRLLSVDALAGATTDNQVLDPHSVLISRFATLGEGNVFYPGVVIQSDEDSVLTIGSQNVFYPGAFLLAESGGRLEIGSHGSYGPGGVQLKANARGAAIVVGDRVRLTNGPEIVGETSIGDGGQLIGPIRAQSVQIAGGGDHTEPDVDRRAGVLKGVGLARGTRVEVGEVVNGLGNFADARVERQSVYHPRA